MIDYLGRVLTTIAIGRHAAMRKAGVPSIRMAKYSEQEVEDGWQTYHRDCKELLAEADQIGMETKSRPYSARVSSEVGTKFIRVWLLITYEVLADRCWKDYVGWSSRHLPLA